MEPISLVLLTCLVLVAVAFWFNKSQNPKSTLPGPRGLPIVGYLPFITTKSNAKLYKLSKKYGPVYKLQLGSLNVVVICGYKPIKDALSQTPFTSRIPTLEVDPGPEIKKPVAFSVEKWKDHRRFTFNVLRGFGFGKTQVEEHIKIEISELVQRLEDEARAPFSMASLLQSSVTNNIISLVFGKRMSHDNPLRQRLDKNHEEVQPPTFHWSMFFPPLRTFMKATGLIPPIKSTQFLEDFISKEIDGHLRNSDSDSIPDMIDEYVEEMKKDSNNTKEPMFKRENLEDMCRVFLRAGTEPLSFSIERMMLLCAALPHVQRKMQQEIDTAFGPDGDFNYLDKVKTPYTEAAICEMLRCNIATLIHSLRLTLSDTYFQGHFIPKNTIVTTVLHSISHDTSLWGDDVDEFRPERFFSKDGTVQKPDYLTPFSIGKRTCAGKLMAEIEVYMYVVAILQKFEVSIPPGKEKNFKNVTEGDFHYKTEICLKLRKL